MLEEKAPEHWKKKTDGLGQIYADTPNEAWNEPSWKLNSLFSTHTKTSCTTHSLLRSGTRFRRSKTMVGPQGFEPWTPGFPHGWFRRRPPKDATVS